MTSSDTIAGLGARTDHVALSPMLDRARLRLTPEESQLLDAVGKVAMIGDLLTRSGMPEPKAISVLLALRVKGAIVPARVARPLARTSTGELDAALLENVELDEARKKEILDFERRLDAMNHYDVLGIAPGADREAVKRGYHEASKRYHPDRFFGKNLGSFRSRVETIFKRVSDANAVLSDDARRAAYLKAHPELTAPAQRAVDPEEEKLLQQRDAERRARLARHPYLAKAAKAKELLDTGKAAMKSGDFEGARSALEHAATLDPRRSEAKDLTAEARKKETQRRAAVELENGNDLLRRGDASRALEAFRTACRIDPDNGPAALKLALLSMKLNADLKDAKVALQHAVEVEPRNVQYRVVLAQIHDGLGLRSLAKKFLEDALKLDPNHAEAKAAMKKMRWPF